MSRADELWRLYESSTSLSGSYGRVASRYLLNGEGCGAQHLATRCVEFEQYAGLSWALWHLETTGMLPDNPLADARVRRCEERFEAACAATAAKEVTP